VIDGDEVLLLVPTVPRARGGRRLRRRHRGQFGQHRRADAAVDALADEPHPDRSGADRRLHDARLPAVRDDVLRRLRSGPVRRAELAVGGPISALLRPFQRRRPHRLHLAHRRPRHVPLRHRQVTGHVISSRCPFRFHVRTI